MNQHTRRDATLGAVVLASTVAVCGAILHCGSGLPSAQQQGEVGLYGAALQACIAKAQLTDAGLAGYRTCAAGVDATFARDGGT